MSRIVRSILNLWAFLNRSHKSNTAIAKANTRPPPLEKKVERVIKKVFATYDMDQDGRIVISQVRKLLASKLNPRYATIDCCLSRHQCVVYCHTA